MRQSSEIVIHATQNVTVPITPDSRRRWRLMEEDSVVLSFNLTTSRAFAIGDWINDEIFGKFVITEEPTPPDYVVETGAYHYELRFDREYIGWKNYVFMLTYGTSRRETEWTLTDKLSVHLDEVVKNLSILGLTYTYVIDAEGSEQAATVTYSGTDIYSALQTLADTYKCEWWVVGNVIHFGKCEVGETVEFGLTNTETIAPSRNDNDYANRLYVFGSTKNIPDTYRKDLIFKVSEKQSVGSSVTLTWTDNKQIWNGTEEYSADNAISQIIDVSSYDWVTLNIPSYYCLLFAYSGGTYTIIPPYTGGMVSDYDVRNVSQVRIQAPITEKGNVACSVKTDGVYFRDSLRVLKPNMVAGGSDDHDISLTRNGWNFAETLALAGGHYDLRGTFTVKIHFTRVPANFGTATITVTWGGTTVKTQSYALQNGTDTRWSGIYPLALSLNESLTASAGNTELKFTVAVSTTETYTYSDFESELALQSSGVPVSMNIRVNGSNIPVIYNEPLNYDGWFKCSSGSIGVGTEFTIDDSYLNITRIPSSYYQDTEGDPNSLRLLGERRLMLPEGTAYIGDAVTTDKLVEKVVIFDEIYPRCALRITSISERTGTQTTEYSDGSSRKDSFTQYTIKAKRITSGGDVAFPFSKEYLTAQPLQLKFISPDEEVKYTNGTPHGKSDGYLLCGMTFDLQFNESDGSYTIAWNDTYGAQLPNASLRPKVGDPFILIGWNTAAMAALGLIGTAEDELVSAGTAYLEAIEQMSFTFDCGMMSDWAVSNGVLPFGQKVRVVRGNLDETSRVIGYELKLDIPEDTPHYTIGETAAYSALRNLQRQLNAVVMDSSSSGAIAIPTSGSASVVPSGSSSLADLDDVDMDGIEAGGVLVWDADRNLMVAGKGSSDFFEIGSSDTLVQLQQAYEYLGPRKGLIFDSVLENDSSDADLYVKWVGEGTNRQRVLYSPLALITEGDQIVKDGTPGGGGGGGAHYMSDLEDVVLTTLYDGQMLAWDWSLRNGQGGWKNINAPTGSVTSISVNGQTYSPSGGVVTLPNYPTIPSTYAWSAITGTPTTLGSGGYGITDAKIENGVITLGSNSITPLTSHQTIYGLTLKVGTSTVGSYTPNSSAQILTVTAQNLYDTIGSTKYHPYGGDTASNTFKIGGATFTWHPESVAGAGDAYLELNSAFVTSGDQIVVSGTPGGGGGEGVDHLYKLEDVYGDYTTERVKTATGATVSDGQALVWNENLSKWVAGTIQSSGGTVTSVGLSMPTGFSVSSSPITSSGTLAVSFASGYSLPTTAKQTNWDTAYGWGNHANAGYLLASTASSTYQPIISDLSDIRSGASAGATAVQPGSVKTLTLKVGTSTVGSGYNPLGADNTTLTISSQNIYDVIGSSKYHPYGGSTTLTTFKIGGATLTWHPESSSGAGDAYLEINSALLTFGDQIVNGGTPGGGGGGVDSLYKLEDVYGNYTTEKVKTATGEDVSDGQALVWNSGLSKWVAGTVQGGGSVTSVVGQTGDVTAAQISTAIGLGNYLPLAGGVMTGAIKMNYVYQSGANFRFIDNRAVSGGSGWADIVLNIYTAAESSLASIGIYGNADALTYLYIGSNDYNGVNLRINSSSIKWGDNNILHAGNYSSYALPLAGGTMTADAAISWGTNDRTDWDTYVDGIRVMSSASTSSGAPTQYATAISVKARYSFQLAVQGGDYDNFYIRAKTRSWMQILHSGNYASYNNYTSGLKVSGRPYGSGDDEGIVVAPAANGYAGLTLGSNSGRRSVFYLPSSGAPFWRYNDETTSYNISHPGKTGTIALTSDISTAVADYLPLSAGSSKPLTGDLYITAGKGIEATGGAGLLVYRPATETWTGVSNTQWAVGAVDSQGIIRSSNTDLIHCRNGSNYTIWDASNSNLSTVNWSAKSLTLAGAITGATTGAFSSDVTIGGDLTLSTNYKAIKLADSGGTARGVLELTSSNNVHLGRLSTQAGYNTYINGNNIYFRYGSSSTVGMILNSSGNFGIGTDSPSYKLHVNGDIALKNAGVLRGYDTGGTARTMIGLDTDNAMYVGWGVATAGYDSQYCGNNILFKTSTSHTTRMYINSSGNVTLGSSDLASTNYKFYVNGSAFATRVVVRTASDYGVLIGGSGSNVIDGLAPSDAYGNLHLNYNSTGHVTLCRGGGNVGIGTTSPSYKLHVDGSAAATTLKALSTSAEAHLIFSRGGANYVTTPSGGSVFFVMNGKTVSSANSTLRVIDGDVQINGMATHSGGHIYLTGANASSSTGGTTQIVFGTSSSNHVAISSNTDAVIINPTTSTTTGQIILGVNTASSTFGTSVTFKGAANRFVSDTWTNVGIKRAAAGGAWICFYPSNQETYFWDVGASTVSSNSTNFSFEYQGNGIKAYLTPSGTFSTVGDQVVSSDINLKENLQPVKYTIEDIAKTRAVTFDWKDGRGHSAGSIAQDWKPLIPELVHGEEGNMTLAYGQIALVNTILLARKSESHEERIKELEARVAELEMENERLRMN